MNNFFSPHSVKVRLLVPVGSPFPAAADSGGLPSSRQFPEWEIASCDLASPQLGWENSARTAEAKSAKNTAQ